ncbi:MAG: hypothetical protein KJ077_23915 [Anaerolineae bacterium]|nr:hypothetical protein [Anaerolineae bacterium]
MASMIQTRVQAHMTEITHHSCQRKNTSPSHSMVAYSLRTSWVGSFGVLILTLLGLIPPADNLPSLSLAILVVPGFLMVCICTGLLACIDAEDCLKNNLQSTQLGWMAGYWVGIFGGIVAMIMAAIGVYMPEFGHGVVGQFTLEQLEFLEGYGLTVEIITLAGRVLGAMVMYGVIGSLIAGVCGALGGLFYPVEEVQQLNKNLS